MDIYYIGYLISGVVILICIIIALVAQSKVSRAYSKYKDMPSSIGLTGAEFAQKLMENESLALNLRSCRGHLSDHYDPSDHSINISEENYNSSSIASLAIVAHEFGHAQQDDQEYFPYKVRQFVVKTSNLVSSLFLPLLIIGILLQLFWIALGGAIIIYLSVALYAVSVIASIATLPVEFNASSRAKKMLDSFGIDKSQQKGVDSVLNAAAMTYVASLLVSMAYLLRYIFLLLAIRRD